MPSCVFRKCNNYTGTSTKDGKDDVSFHLFPKDELLKQKWAQIVRSQRREDDWRPTTYSTICSEHFVESDKYVTKKNVRKLIKTAIPIIEVAVIEHKENLPAVSDDDSLKHREINTTFLKLKDEPISDNDSVFDSLSREAYLERKITKISQAKEKIQMKNYNLAKQNKRLKKKCDELQKILSKLMRRSHAREQTDIQQERTDII